MRCTRVIIVRVISALFRFAQHMHNEYLIVVFTPLLCALSDRKDSPHHVQDCQGHGRVCDIPRSTESKTGSVPTLPATGYGVCWFGYETGRDLDSWCGVSQRDEQLQHINLLFTTYKEQLNKTQTMY